MEESEEPTPIVSNKEKLKIKPKIGAGSKEEKRKQKKEKLVKALQKKNEEKIAEATISEKKREAPVTFGQEFYDSLFEVMSTDVSSMVRKPTKRQKTYNAVSQMKKLFARSDFTNPDAIFEEVDGVIDKKATNLQRKLEEEEQMKLEKEMREKQKNENNK